jgi:hypothetical protein
VMDWGLQVGAAGRLRRAATPDPAQRLSPAEAP